MQITALSPPKTENRRAWNVRGIVQLLWSDPHGSSHPTSSKKIVGGFNLYLNEYIACLSRTNKTLISDHIWVKTFCKRQRLVWKVSHVIYTTTFWFNWSFLDVKSLKWSKRCLVVFTEVNRWTNPWHLSTEGPSKGFRPQVEDPPSKKPSQATF